MDNFEKPSKLLSRREVLKLKFLPSPDQTAESTYHRLPVVTPNADFYPIYENHSLLREAKSLPPNRIDIFFTEFKTNKLDPDLYRLEPTDIIKFQNQFNIPLFPPEIVSRLQKDSSVISGEFMKYPEKYLLVPYVDGLIRYFSWAILEYFAYKEVVPTVKKDSSSPLSTRREFLKAALLAAGGFAVTAFNLTDLILLSDPELGNNQSLIQQINAFASNLEPENIDIFFRNALMAKKLLLLGSAYNNSPTAGKPNIVYDVGLSHSGMEWFLSLGPKAVSDIICHYPKFLLKDYIRTNGGLDEFCSTLVFSPSGNSKRIHLDNELKSTLEQKLAS